MLFISHDEDGRIEQANKVFDYEGYGAKLSEAGHRFIIDPRNSVIAPDDWYVSKERLRQRKPMPISINRTRVRAGSSETAVLKHIPSDAAVQVWTLGELLHNFPKLGASELEIQIPVPLIYKVTVRKFPYLDFAVAVEAV